MDGEISLPSPEDLKEKIIIKGKRLSEDENLDIIQLENKYKLAREMSDLVWYCKSRKFTSFDVKKCKQKVCLFILSY